MNKTILFALLLFSSTLVAQSWVALSAPPFGKHHPISFSLNGKGYAVTGTSLNNQFTNDVYEYDPTNDTWTTLSNFPGLARSFGIGTVANGKAYLGFGANSTQYLNDFWSFDATTNTWTQLASCTCAGRRHPAMISDGNRIYIGFGDNNVSGNLNDWWMYDIATNTWASISNVPGPDRHHPFMFNAGGEIFAGLGHGFNGSFGVVYDDWYRLNTTTNTWIAMSDFPGEARVAGTQFGFNGYGFVLSGDGDNHNFMNTGEMWQYDPNADTWLELTPHPGRSRWAPGSFIIGTDIYFFTGLDRFNSTYPADLWKFDLSSATASMEDEDSNFENTYVYPNPANGSISWKNDPSITDVRVYNSLGQLLMTPIAEEKRMNTSNLKDGFYLFQFYSNSKLVKTSKAIIQHK
jgi:N-acetylneuraminic acid mutarotase